MKQRKTLEQVLELHLLRLLRQKDPGQDLDGRLRVMDVAIRVVEAMRPRLTPRVVLTHIYLSLPAPDRRRIRQAVARGFQEMDQRERAARAGVSRIMP